MSGGGEDTQGPLEPLILPEGISRMIKEYYENSARGFFPKPKSICLEDITAALLDDFYFEASAGWFWVFFPRRYGLAKTGKRRVLVCTQGNPLGVEDLRRS